MYIMTNFGKEKALKLYHIRSDTMKTDNFFN